MNNQTKSKLLLFLRRQISTRVGMTIIVVAFSIFAVILVWQAELLKQEMKALEMAPKVIIKPEATIKDETMNWKTYRNEEHSFEIKYPESWMTREYSPGRQSHFPKEERTIKVSFASNQEDLIRENGVNIFVSPLNFISWELYIQTENVICKEEIIIQNIRDLINKGEIKQDCFTGESFYFSSFSDRIFRFYAGIEGKQIFNQMLSTFRFLE